MNVLMIVSWFGKKNIDKFTGNFHVDFAKEMKKIKDVNLAIYFPFDRNIEGLFEYAYEDNVLIFRGRQFSNYILDKNKIYDDYDKISKIFTPDVIHAHVTYKAGDVAWYINIKHQIPYVVTEHLPVELMHLNFLRKKKYKKIQNGAKTNITVSPDLRDKLNVMFPEAQYIYINNGVIDPLNLVADGKNSIKTANRYNIAFVGGLYSKKIKGLHLLLPAIKRINYDGFDVHLHIVGGGKYLNYYTKMVEKMGISDMVSFYGMLDKPSVFFIMKQMDFMVSSSLFESAGVAVEEACLIGKPQVITKSGGSNSLVNEDVSIIVERGSVDALYEGIKMMIENIESFDLKKIREYGLKEFEMSNVIEKYLLIYNKANCKMEMICDEWS